MTGIFRTLARVLAGFVLACIAAGLVQVLFVDTPKELAALPAGELPERASTTLARSLLTATHFAVFSSAFALIAAGIAEWLRLRSPGYWLAAGTGIALLGFIAQYASEVSGQPSILNNYALQAYLTAGFFGGLVYWLVAGSRAGGSHAADGVAIAGDAPVPAETPRPRIIVEKVARGGELKKGSLAEKLAWKRAAKEQEQPALGEPASPAKSPQAAPADKAPPPPAPAAATAVPVTSKQPAAPPKQTSTAEPPPSKA